ncbi:DUF5344 family protein [Metabacillus iocasae]|uniref:YwqI/YxiC family protein n=1 Tax=Priestia iocasae TaxID=2291674 RepID=A0ABS2QY30_9BACI|nr:DUF5344 family protein [Metabacillus iocasae]MBM7704395.1 hypothetical protein [Metabacillus iocasae]
MGEIKFKFHDIEQVVKAMETASTSFEPQLPKDVVKNNQLDVVEEMAHMNMMLEKLMTTYKALLAKNEAMLRHSVEAMKEADESLKTSMSLKGVAEVEK